MRYLFTLLTLLLFAGDAVGQVNTSGERLLSGENGTASTRFIPASSTFGRMFMLDITACTACNLGIEYQYTMPDGEIFTLSSPGDIAAAGNHLLFFSNAGTLAAYDGLSIVSKTEQRLNEVPAEVRITFTFTGTSITYDVDAIKTN